MAALNEKEKELFNLIFQKLITLPAYELSRLYQNIFKKYFYKQLEISITNKSLKYDDKVSEDIITAKECIRDTYQKPNQWKLFWFSFDSLPNKYKIIGCISIIFLFFSFLVKTSNHWLAAIGILSYLLHFIFYYIFSSAFIIWLFQVSSVFSIINCIFKNIQEHIIDLRHLENDSLENRENIIVRRIIQNEISRVDDLMKQQNSLSVLFAFFVCLAFVVIVGDTFIDEIIWTVNISKVKNFTIIQELTLEKFIGMLFAASCLLSNLFIFRPALTYRRKQLTNSQKQNQESIN